VNDLVIKQDVERRGIPFCNRVQIGGAANPVCHFSPQLAAMPRPPNIAVRRAISRSKAPSRSESDRPYRSADALQKTLSRRFSIRAGWVNGAGMERCGSVVVGASAFRPVQKAARRAEAVICALEAINMTAPTGLPASPASRGTRLIQGGRAVGSKSEAKRLFKIASVIWPRGGL
jgi:hypothetical protein